MNSATEEMVRKALELPPGERAELADRLLASLDRPDRDIDRLWRDEVAQRLKAYQTGQAQTVSVEEVLAKYRSR